MIEIENLHVRYASERGIVHAVRGIDIRVETGQFYTLLGPSGCGKTTTLRCIAGLEAATEGRISIGGETVYSSTKQIALPPYKRDIGMVFQSYAIWPHLNVFENVAFPLREMRGRFNASEIKEKVKKALQLVQLDGFQDRPAPFLSGGQQQRLALARALVREPKVLLLDEPLSNLDAKLREDTRVEVRELVKRLGITTVYVTHDQLEALTMSDVVAVMDQGRIVQEASPVDIYRKPKQRFVANFIGLSNFIEAKVTALPKTHQGLGEAETSNGRMSCVLPDTASVGDKVTVVIRPEDISFDDLQAGQNKNVLEGKVASAMFLGDAMEFQVAVGADLIRMKMHASTSVRPGDMIRFGLPAESCRALAN
ncbi:MAG TPA: ABC transporter ATP-binding protein [Alphaproteobacteria bacterium]